MITMEYIIQVKSAVRIEEKNVTEKITYVACANEKGFWLGRE